MNHLQRPPPPGSGQKTLKGAHGAARSQSENATLTLTSGVLRKRERRESETETTDCLIASAVIGTLTWRSSCCSSSSRPSPQVRTPYTATQYRLDRARFNARGDVFIIMKWSFSLGFNRHVDALFRPTVGVFYAAFRLRAFRYCVLFVTFIYFNIKAIQSRGRDRESSEMERNSNFQIIK